MIKQAAPSLVSYFNPPEGMKGEFGLITGYSADGDFFNDALEKFTGNMQAHRAYEGSASLVLMLDPKHPQIPITDCYGLLHLPFKSEKTKPFNLLHAKVAILLFKGIETDEYSARLIVSTGNWTRQTLEDSLDLVWSIDVNVDQSSGQESTDFAAAYHFLTKTLKYFDSSILSIAKAPAEMPITQLRFENFHRLMSSIKAEEGFKPRFFDNRKASLLSQLPELVKQHAGSQKRNYLALGSGFYQGGDKTGVVPSVISAIESDLSDQGLLTKKSVKDIVVNPKGCQAVAENLAPLEESGWKVLSAYDPFYHNLPNSRDLHAKFIFSAKEINNQKECKHAWLYLGSGNLTGPGFNQKASTSGGNLEAGVVFSPLGLTWFDSENPENCISNKLPILWEESQYMDESTCLTVGSEMPEHDSLYQASPIAFFTIEASDNEKWVLKPNAPLTDDLSIADLSPEKYSLIREKNELHWFDKQPRQIPLRWQNEIILIPVIDEYGRIAASELPELALDDAWQIFSTFPLLPFSESDEDVFERDMSSKGQVADSDIGKRSYDINKMMAFVELIAERQTSAPQQDWAQWCIRLEQTFEQLKNDEILSFFRGIDINPLSPLWEQSFRPVYAENTKTDEGKRYEQLLTRLEAKLGLDKLMRLG